MNIKQFSCLAALLIVGAVSFAQGEETTQRRDRGNNWGEVDLPSKLSLKQFCPMVKNQGPYGTSSAWASVYAARTIAEAANYGWTDKEQISREAFSPLFVYAQAKNRSDLECERGIHIHEALDVMKETGCVKFSDFDALCADASAITESLKFKASKFRIDDYKSLFSINCKDAKEKEIKVKKSLAEGRPVVIAMWLPPMFSKTEKVMELGNVESKFPVKNIKASDYHAMCVVGYDDDKFGGAFQIMNSWGTGWGDDGFFWAKYDDFARTVDQAYELCVRPIQKRIALVIGNSYGMNQSFPKLRTPENDAVDFAKKLDSLGFEVNSFLNVGQQEMIKAIDTFCAQAKGYDVALLFLTGTGLRIANQDCFAANDSRLGFDMKSQFVVIDDVMEKMHQAGCPLRIGLFDMCRNEYEEPVHRGFKRMANKGMVEQGEIRIFASKRGGSAFDGFGEHSPFYEAISVALSSYPGITLDDFEKKVSEYVFEKTDGKQMVSSEKAMVGDFRFTVEKRNVE